MELITTFHEVTKLSTKKVLIVFFAKENEKDNSNK